MSFKQVVEKPNADTVGISSSVQYEDFFSFVFHLSECNQSLHEHYVNPA